MDRTSEVVEDGSDLNFDETAAGIDVPGIRRSTRVRVPTERGLDYQLPLRKKNYNQCKKKLEDKLNALDMSWTELSDPEAWRKERTFLEDTERPLWRDPRSSCCYYQANMPMMWLVKQIT